MKLFLLILFISLASCSEDEKECIEKLKANCTCSTNYDPVCGCNGITYGNSCMAECASITEYEKGECLN
ncbi:Kazal-type serine protease inhibitor domain-containing protein [Reichenbachiella faecimaris]|uniref:Kazal-type serine protease inhibitor domain-containing protein n=1 Tax=Reichenbachiella faecimaris TaxID=692418 RepID=A0A1W2GK83_REIFA|nr:Kazal-type serine protease inhibitor domain-containing protein [Reichenbachiella faecimaris]SMD36758.1 Kazal-type serine protease inhibitor domain-containing protein [Reichenbachiella faecimaris]